MPTEVLSHFLKNSDRKLRLGFQVALQCAPFLKGLKVSCVISLDEELYSGLAELFTGMDVIYHMLSRSDGKCLVLFYRPIEMKAYLADKQVRALLSEYGYSGMCAEEMLLRLSERIRDFSGREMGFPHEIGVFLGYPPEDVKGFIENEGKRYLMEGVQRSWAGENDLSGI